jgi:hypothetical protein
MRLGENAGMPAEIQFFWWRECPSWERALGMVREEMASRELEEDRLEIIEIKDEEDARRLGFPGSPTILVGGRDIQEPDPRGASGLTCRVYRRRDGRVSPLPDPEDLRDAFAKIGP